SKSWRIVPSLAFSPPPLLPSAPTRMAKSLATSTATAKSTSPWSMKAQTRSASFWATATAVSGPKRISPRAAVKEELIFRLETALNSMEPLDREVLVLRHFEQLSNIEAAQVLNIQQSAASKRYIRALQRLKDILKSMPGGLQEWQA